MSDKTNETQIWDPEHSLWNNQLQELWEKSLRGFVRTSEVLLVEGDPSAQQ